MNENAYSTIDLYVRRNAQMGIKMKDNKKTHKNWLCLIIVMGVCFFIANILFLYFYMVKIKHNGETNIMEYQQMVGDIDSGTSVEYSIIDILKGKMDLDKIEDGKELLSSYGFSDTFFQDKVNVTIYFNLITVIAIMVIVSLEVFLLFLCYVKFQKYNRKKEIIELEEIILELTKGNFDVVMPFHKENYQRRIYQLMEQLRQRTSIILDRMNIEKENTKSLVTDISHQLKTPLASLSMYLTLLEDDKLNKEEIEEFITRSEEQVVQIEGLILALINISRMESGMIDIKQESKDVYDTLVSAIRGVYSSASKKNITIDGEGIFHLDIPHDSKWTEEAFKNLLENAIKYSPNDSVIRIQMEELQNYLRIIFQDEGIGVNIKESAEIFKRFYRSTDPKVKNEKGWGVGLYLTRKILEEQRGNVIVKTIKIQEQNIDNPGAEFIVSLPLKF